MCAYSWHFVSQNQRGLDKEGLLPVVSTCSNFSIDYRLRLHLTTHVFLLDANSLPEGERKRRDIAKDYLGSNQRHRSNSADKQPQSFNCSAGLF